MPPNLQEVSWAQLKAMMENDVRIIERLEHQKKSLLIALAKFPALEDPAASGFPDKPPLSDISSNEELKRLQQEWLAASDKAWKQAINFQEEINYNKKIRADFVRLYKAGCHELSIHPEQASVNDPQDPGRMPSHESQHNNHHEAGHGDDDLGLTDENQMDVDQDSSEDPRAKSAGPERTRQQTRRIIFDQVYQDGRAEPKNQIVEYPSNSRKYYIIRCDIGACEGRTFGRKPHSGGGTHLLQKHGDGTPKTQENVIRRIGIRVLGCDQKLADRNNEAFDRWYDSKEQEELRRRRENERRSRTSRRGREARSKSNPGRTVSDSEDQGASSGEKSANEAYYDALPLKSQTRKRSIRRVDPGENDPPAEVEAGKVYCYEKRKPGSSLWVAIIIPMFEEWSSHLATVLDTAHKQGFFTRENQECSPVPECIDYDHQTETASGWRGPFRDGGPRASDRVYPAVIINGREYPGNAKLQWVPWRDLRPYNANKVAINEAQGVKDYTSQMNEAKRVMRESEHALLAANDTPSRASSEEADYGASQQSRRELPRETESETTTQGHPNLTEAMEVSLRRMMRQASPVQQMTADVSVPPRRGTPSNAPRIGASHTKATDTTGRLHPDSNQKSQGGERNRLSAELEERRARALSNSIPTCTRPSTPRTANSSHREWPPGESRNSLAGGSRASRGAAPTSRMEPTRASRESSASSDFSLSDIPARKYVHLAGTSSSGFTGAQFAPGRKSHRGGEHARSKSSPFLSTAARRAGDQSPFAKSRFGGRST